MRREPLVVAGIAALALAALVFAAWVYRSGREAAGPPPVDPGLLVRSENASKGVRGAPVTVVEFLDPECEACAAIYPMVERLLAEYPGQIRLVVRYMPLHQNSVLAASALEAAGEQGRYWEMLDALFRNQPAWADHRTPRPELIPGYAREIGLDMVAFQPSFAGERHRAKIERDRADAERLGVHGTPAFFVNGRRLERLGYEPLKQLVDEEFAKRGGPGLGAPG